MITIYVESRKILEDRRIKKKKIKKIRKSSRVEIVNIRSLFIIFYLSNEKTFLIIDLNHYKMIDDSFFSRYSYPLKVYSFNYLKLKYLECHQKLILFISRIKKKLHEKNIFQILFYRKIIFFLWYDEYTYKNYTEYIIRVSYILSIKYLIYNYHIQSIGIQTFHEYLKKSSTQELKHLIYYYYIINNLLYSSTKRSLYQHL